MTTSMEDRVSRMEGAYAHLATKEDVANLRADMATKEDLRETNRRIDRVYWAVLGVGTVIAGAVLAGDFLAGAVLAGDFLA